MTPRTPYAPWLRSTLWDLLETTARRLPEKIAFVHGADRLTFAQLRDRAEALAGGLAGLGLGHGDRAAVYMPNSLELVTTFYALQRLGVVTVWINPAYRHKEVRFLLENSGAKAAFVFPSWGGIDHRDTVLELAPGLPALEHVVVVGEPTVGPGRHRWSDLAAAAPPTGPCTVGPEDLAMFLYTSGTTGRSKGAMIAQSQAVRAGLSYALVVDAGEDDVLLGFLPMAHSYGCGACLIQPVVLGATLVILDRFRPEDAFALIEHEKITVQPGAPAHYLMELDHPRRGEYDLSSLRAGTIAGQIAPAGLIRRVEEEMGVYISSFLGSSEVGPGNSLLLPPGSSLELRERCVGAPIPGTEARVADPVTGEPCADGTPGELHLTGWHLMQGYWDNPEETRRQVVDGWLHTGDLAVRHPDGNYQILGRLKEWINRGGFKILPSELEALIVDHPRVAEACVVATPNPVLGESICACLRLSDGRLGLHDLREFLKGRVADFKLPDELLVLDEFPRMPGGLKINRFGEGGLGELATTAPAKESLRPS